LSHPKPPSPLLYLLWAFLALLIYQAGFWVDALSVDEGQESSPSLTFREVAQSTEGLSLSEHWQNGKRKPVIDEGVFDVTFLKMGQVGSSMPLNGRLAWNEGDGVKLQKLVRGQRFFCRSLTGDASLELEPLGVQEKRMNGGYRYVLKMVDGLGKIYELPLERGNHRIRLFTNQIALEY
jgi:hypothetical protein